MAEISLAGTANIFYELESIAVSENIGAVETFIIALNAADTRYILRGLRLKSADPGVGETIAVKLYEFLNGVEVMVDDFEIDHNNFETSHSLMGMFGSPAISGDSIRVSLTGGDAGPIAVTGQYSYGRN